MDTPRGLRKPHHFAALIPVLLTFIGVAMAAFAALYRLTQAGPEGPNPGNAGRAAGVAPSTGSVEFLTGIGIALLFIGLAWGMWQYSRRNRANDPVSEVATREIYRNPDYREERPDLENRLRPS